MLIHHLLHHRPASTCLFLLVLLHLLKVFLSLLFSGFLHFHMHRPHTVIFLTLVKQVAQLYLFRHLAFLCCIFEEKFINQVELPVHSISALVVKFINNLMRKQLFGTLVSLEQHPIDMVA